MITNICLNNVSSYKVASLDTDKKINLIYGLNGTGKSTFSNFLYDRTDQDFSGCHINGLKDEEIIVYNQKFIKENFFEAEGLKGIFTLSKDNQIAAQKINDATSEIKRLEQEKIIKDIELEQIKNAINSKLESAELKTWEIKTNYYGGDRVLEFCLRGYVGSKSALFNHIKSLTKPNTQPSKTIEIIKEEVQAIAGENSQKYDELPEIKFEMQNIENDHLFLKQIIGNESSSVASLINKLSNSDWIKDGLKYLPNEIFNKNEQCPFCQEHTISGLLLERIKEYFDESYESDLRQLKIFLISYKMASDLIIEKSDFDANSKIMTYRKDFEIKYNNFTRVLSNNLVLIENKIKSPSMLVSLESSNNSLEELNDLISTINKTIVEHNRKIDLKSQSLEELKKEFLALMRWDYDQTISTFAAEKNLSDKAVNASEVIVENLKIAIFNQNSIIIEQQKQTVNIQEAITSINSSLIDLGVDDFHIKHHSGNLYNICRGENNQKIFHSLSEGEKMIVSFLYFMELCRGKKDPNDTGSKKIIVIDDPISSLSHIHIFNIGRLIRNEFFG